MSSSFSRLSKPESHSLSIASCSLSTKRLASVLNRTLSVLNRLLPLPDTAVPQHYNRSTVASYSSFIPTLHSTSRGEAHSVLASGLVRAYATSVPDSS
eukprot:876397-Rhodomonas_salina.1